MHDCYSRYECQFNFYAKQVPIQFLCQAGFYDVKIIVKILIILIFINYLLIFKCTAF